MTTRQEIADEAREWLGTPWKHQACLKGVGSDCIGLLGGIAARKGVTQAWIDGTAAKYRGYGRDPNPDRLRQACNELLLPISISDARLADIFVFRFFKEPQHFALISRVDPMYIIHALAQSRKVVEHRVDEVWRSRIVAAYRFKGLH